MVKKQINNNQESITTEDLKFNIERANEIVRDAQKQVKTFLEINLALVTAFSFLFVYIMDKYTDINVSEFSWGLSIIGYFLIIVVIIIYKLTYKTTKGIKKSICFYRHWKYHNLKKNLIEIDTYSFKGDYKTQLLNLHKYQRNYDHCAKIIGNLTLIGILFLIISFITNIIINLIFRELNCCSLKTIIILYIIIGIILIIFWLKYLRDKNYKEKVEYVEFQVPKDLKSEARKHINSYMKELKKNKTKEKM